MKDQQRVGVQIHCRPLLDTSKCLQGYVWYIVSAHDQAPQSFVEGMPLADDIVDALVHQVGDMGHALQLAMTLEGVGASVELSFANLDVCALSMMYVQSTGWAYAVWSQ